MGSYRCSTAYLQPAFPAHPRLDVQPMVAEVAEGI
jgi:hypothetical protein